jgi:hypothetical protein
MTLALVLLACLSSSCGKSSPRLDSNLSEARLEAVRQETNQWFLARIAAHGKEELVRNAAWEKLTDTRPLTIVALTAKQEWMRLEAVERLTNLAALTRIALEGEPEKVRGRAYSRDLPAQLIHDELSRLTNQPVLKRGIIESSWYCTNLSTPALFICIDRLSRQEDLAHVAIHARGPELRHRALGRISDQMVLAEVVIESRNDDVSWTAVQRIRDDVALSKVAIEDRNQDVNPRSFAVKAITNQAILAKVAFSDEGTWIRRDAMEKLTDESTVAKVAAHEKDPRIRELPLIRYSKLRLVRRQSALRQTRLPEAVSATLKRSGDPAIDLATAVADGVAKWYAAIHEAGTNDSQLEIVLSAMAISMPDERLQSSAAGLCRNAISTGNPEVVADIVALLENYGDKGFAENLMNCGQPELEDAGRTWALKKGYLISHSETPKVSKWGSRR